MVVCIIDAESRGLTSFPKNLAIEMKHGLTIPSIVWKIEMVHGLILSFDNKNDETNSVATLKPTKGVSENVPM